MFWLGVSADRIGKLLDQLLKLPGRIFIGFEPDVGCIVSPLKEIARLG